MADNIEGYSEHFGILFGMCFINTFYCNSNYSIYYSDSKYLNKVLFCFIWWKKKTWKHSLHMKRRMQWRKCHHSRPYLFHDNKNTIRSRCCSFSTSYVAFNASFCSDSPSDTNFWARYLHECCSIVSEIGFTPSH